MNARKKWLVAIFVSKKEKIIKLWKGQVNYDTTDVSLPDNTLFYFFSTSPSDKILNLEIINLKILEQDIKVWISNINELIHENKLYCCGHLENGSLIITNSGFKIEVKDFEKISNQFRIEFV